MLPRATGVADRKGLDSQIAGRRGSRHGHVVEARHEAGHGTGDHMHAAGIGRNRHQPVEVARRGLEQRLAPAGIELSRAAQMRGEMAVGDESRQRALSQQRCSDRDAVDDPFGGLDQRGRQHEEAETQRREEQLGEAAEVGDAARAIE